MRGGGAQSLRFDAGELAQQVIERGHGEAIDDPLAINTHYHYDVSAREGKLHVKVTRVLGERRTLEMEGNVDDLIAQTHAYDDLKSSGLRGETRPFQPDR